MDKILSHLNKSQQQAVLYNDGHTIIQAGPGTGKTFTLVSKVLYLLQSKFCSASEVLVLTFTNRAARELNKRLNDFGLTKKPYTGTFHAFALKQIHDLQDFTLIDQKSKKTIITDLLQNNNLLNQKIEKRTVRNIEKNLSLLQNRSQLQKLSKVEMRSLKIFYKQYQKYLKHNQLFDFSELLIYLYYYLKKNQTNHQYVLIDEFQDVNQIQFDIIKHLGDTNKKIIAIGDKFQSIYGFRGSLPQIFKQFKNQYDPVKEITLINNYRNAQTIIDVSSQLWKNKVVQKSKVKHEGKVYLLKTLNEYWEADWVIEKINNLVGGLGLLKASHYHETQEVDFADIAIIYRMHATSRVIKEKMYESGIPYQVIGDGSIYLTSQIKLIVDLMKLKLNFTQENLWKVINNDFFRNNATDINLIKKIINDHNIDLQQALQVIVKQSLVTKKHIKQLTILLDFLKTKSFTTQKYTNLIDLLEVIMDHFGINKMMLKSEKLTNHISQFKVDLFSFNNNQFPLQNFIKYVKDLEKKDYYDAKANKITLLTMHSAKGLEFGHVFIIGFNQGLIPLKKKNKTINIDEEKRLLYVALTRARQTVTLIETQKRFSKSTKQSQFCKLMEKKLEKITDKRMKSWEKKQQKIKEEKRQMSLF